MTLRKKLGNFYQRNKLTLKTLSYVTLVLAATLKLGDIGFTALEEHRSSEEYRMRSWREALEDPEFRREVHQMYREHYGQPYEGFQTGTGR